MKEYLDKEGFDAFVEKVKGKFESVENKYQEKEPEYIDLGLASGLLWATCNIGANTPEEPGFYFQWGDTQGWRADQIGNGEGQKKFATDFSDYKYWENGAFIKYTENGAQLEAVDDAATHNMGANFRMPTPDEIGELWELTKEYVYAPVENGVIGEEREYLEEHSEEGIVFDNGNINLSQSTRICLGINFIGNNGNKLFIPAIGGYYGGSFASKGWGVYLWSSRLTSNNINKATFAYFDIYGNGWSEDSRDRSCGVAIRGVKESVSKYKLPVASETELGGVKVKEENNESYWGKIADVIVVKDGKLYLNLGSDASTQNYNISTSLETNYKDSIKGNINVHNGPGNCPGLNLDLYMKVSNQDTPRENAYNLATEGLVYNINKALSDRIDDISTSGYELPIASSNTLGGVKIDTSNYSRDFTVDSTGTLSINPTSATLDNLVHKTLIVKVEDFDSYTYANEQSTDNGVAHILDIGHHIEFVNGPISYASGATNNPIGLVIGKRIVEKGTYGNTQKFLVVVDKIDDTLGEPIFLEITQGIQKGSTATFDIQLVPSSAGYELPIASNDTLGGVKTVTSTRAAVVDRVYNTAAANLLKSKVVVGSEGGIEVENTMKISNPTEPREDAMHLATEALVYNVNKSLNDKIDGLNIPEPYELPIATKTSIGGVKGGNAFVLSEEEVLKYLGHISNGTSYTYYGSPVYIKEDGTAFIIVESNGNPLSTELNTRTSPKLNIQNSSSGELALVTNYFRVSNQTTPRQNAFNLATEGLVYNVQQDLESKITNSSYTLPIASTTELGGVKISDTTSENGIGIKEDGSIYVKVKFGTYNHGNKITTLCTSPYSLINCELTYDTNGAISVNKVNYYTSELTNPREGAYNFATEGLVYNVAKELSNPIPTIYYGTSLTEELLLNNISAIPKFTSVRLALLQEAGTTETSLLCSIIDALSGDIETEFSTVVRDDSGEFNLFYLSHTTGQCTYKEPEAEYTYRLWTQKEIENVIYASPVTLLLSSISDTLQTDMWTSLLGDTKEYYGSFTDFSSGTYLNERKITVIDTNGNKCLFELCSRDSSNNPVFKGSIMESNALEDYIATAYIKITTDGVISIKARL